MAKTVTKKRISGVQRVQWVDKQTTRGIRSREVSVKRTESLRSSSSSPAKSSPAYPMDIDHTPYDPPEPLVIPTSKSQNDYLREWIPKRPAYLSHLLESESRQPGRLCAQCSCQEGLWRCVECLGKPVYCADCCRSRHTRLPFHRIEQWTGQFFRPAWLREVGVVIYLGHNGSPCPTDGNSIFEQAFGDYWEYTDDEDATDHLSDDVPSGSPHDLHGHTKMVIVDKSGIHHVPVRWCRCKGHPDDDAQLFAMGLFAASFQIIKTAFTFAVLDDFLMDNLECKTSAHHYFNKLRRITSPAFPHSVTNRYNELLRVSRQWRNLKDRMWFGFGHEDGDPGLGEMATFCPTCPQPGINLPENWMEDPNRIVYTRGFVKDGNFTAVHQKQKRPEDDVWLTDGDGFMVRQAPYQAHLTIAKEFKEKSTCNEHHALNDSSRTQSGCDVTGIGATACWHGFFCPASVVDFQKGERQMNMDYSFCEALKNSKVNGIKSVIDLYDVNCQYYKRFPERLLNSPYLSIPEGMSIIHGIGLFHVHGHQESCFPRFAPTFITGAGQFDGEILETLWSVLNEISRSTRGATLAYRTELLDAHMNDSNWKKLIDSASTLRKRYNKAKDGLSGSQAYLDELTKSAGPEKVKTWTAQAEKAARDRKVNPEAMDCYYASMSTGHGRDQIQLSLMDEEQKGGFLQGVTSWLATGLKIEETQISVAAHAKKLGRTATNAQKVDLAKKRERLQARIDAFNGKASSYLGSLVLDEGNRPGRKKPTDLDNYDSDSSDDENPFRIPDEVAEEPDNQILLLPSTFGESACRAAQLTDLVRKELKLREGQLNDALHGVRMAVGQKSFFFRTKVRNAKGKYNKTRAWDNIHSAAATAKHHAKVYTVGRQAMVHLGASDILLNKYKILGKKDLEASTTIVDPNARGQSKKTKTLAWFWSLNVQGDCVDNKLMEEFYRVHWLKMKAINDRWHEELTRVKYEMQWIPLYFDNQASVWERRSEISASAGKAGHECYALRQGAMWSKLSSHATETFNSATA